MTFTDAPFFIYLLFSLLVFRLTPLRLRWFPLIVIGAVFYAAMDIRFLYVLILMMLATYWGCWLLARASRQRLALLWFFVSSIILWLFVVKWPTTHAIDWFGPPFSIFPGSKSESISRLSIPIGMSFHALQCISVLVDTYRSPSKWDPRPSRMILYLCYLPQILAGPIERAPHMYPQFEAPKQDSSRDALQGLEWVLKGLFKKLVLADRFAVVLASFSAAPEKFQNPLLTGFVIFSFLAYIYMDLSGYTDMARGMSLWFGIRLSNNFENPLKVFVTGEFWVRWHVTFHMFMRDYVFRPLKRISKNIPLNILIVFLLSGLWHGLGFHFIAWAVVAYAIFVGEHLILRRFPGYRTLPLAKLRSYALGSISASFFFVQSLDAIPVMYRSFLHSYDFRQAYDMMHLAGWRLKDLGIFSVLSLTGILFVRHRTDDRSDLYRWARLLLVVYLILLLRNPTSALHSYFRF